MGSSPALSTMPFGKHKGEPFTELDLDYIQWLLTDFDGLRAPLRSVLEAEVARRQAGPGTAPLDQHSAHVLNDRPRAWRGDSERPPARPTPIDSRQRAVPGVAPAAATSTPEQRIRRVIRLEVAAILTRMAQALEQETTEKGGA